MTDQQIAQEILYSYMDVEKDLSQPKILIHTLKKLRELLSSGYLPDWRDECEVSYCNGYDDCLDEIDKIVEELEQL